MSRHQAYRNYDYENDLDEYEGNDGFEEEEELSPEDRGNIHLLVVSNHQPPLTVLDTAQMDAGIAQVRAALGTESSKVTTQQIQEALWHYYYDIDKSVTYLATKFIVPSSKKKGGRFTSLALPSLHPATNTACTPTYKK